MRRTSNQQAILFLSLILFMIFTACSKNVIVLNKPQSEITRINVKYSMDDKDVLHTLEGDAIESFIEALSTVKLRKNLSPQDIGGSIIIEIIYSDDSCDIIGNYSVGYRSNGILEHDGWYYVPYDELVEVLSNYIDVSQLQSS